MVGEVLCLLVLLPQLSGVAAVPPPQTPSICTASEDIFPGLHGMLAAVRPQAGCNYAWTIVGGTIDSGAGTNQITFGSGTASSLTLSCTVTNAAGVSAADTLVLPIPNGGLSPVPTTTVGGTVQGLSAGALVLQNNQGNNLIVRANGPFTFGVPVASGAPFSVSVIGQPQAQVCSVSNGRGVVGQAGVSNVAVNCAAAPSYPLTLSPTLGARVTDSVVKSFTADQSPEDFSIINAVVEDLDGDGYPELVLGITTYPEQTIQPIIVVEARSGISLIADSMFSGDVPRTKNPSSLFVADINADGLPDLVIGAAGLDHPPWTGSPIAVALNLGGGKFRNISSLVPSSMAQTRSYCVAAGDLFGDGKVETILPDQGEGLHSEVISWNGLGFDENPNWVSAKLWSHPGDLAQASWLGVADLDGDGFQDVIVAGQMTSPSLRVLFGSAQGFQLYNLRQLPEGSWGHTLSRYWSQTGNPTSQGGNLDRLVVADFDGDGRPDIFALAERITYYQPGAFTDQSYFDYQNIFQNGGSVGAEIGLQVLLNRGGRSFERTETDSSTMNLGQLYQLAAFSVDLNNDGAPDVVGIYRTKRTGTQLGFAWGTTFFLNDGTGAFEVVDASVLFPELLSRNSQGELEIGSFFPTQVGRFGMQGVRVLNQADWFSSNKRFVFDKITTARSIGTGPGLLDAAAQGAPGFNEFYYLRIHPDVASLVRSGSYSSGLDHYLRAGRAAGYQAFARHTTAWGGQSAATITLYGGNTYHCGNSGDTVAAGGGANIIYSGPGNDVFSGGTGLDEVVYSGPRGRYQITTNGDGSTTVIDALPGGDGSDRLTGYFTLRFADSLVAVGPTRHQPVSGPPGGQPVVKRP